MQNKNILLLHSFHYPGKTHDGKIFYERYARKVGLEISKMNLPNVIVVESPRNRYYKRLTECYDARLILDLHNDTHPYDPQISHLLAMLYLSSRPKQSNYEKRKSAIRRWIRKKYLPNKNGIFPISITNYALSNKPANYIGIELYPHNRIGKSVEFVKKFTKFLYDHYV